jgi:hypothetical protein
MDVLLLLPFSSPLRRRTARPAHAPGVVVASLRSNLFILKVFNMEAKRIVKFLRGDKEALLSRNEVALIFFLSALTLCIGLLLSPVLAAER